jgi:hypothetical protein
VAVWQGGRDEPIASHHDGTERTPAAPPGDEAQEDVQPADPGREVAEDRSLPVTAMDEPPGSQDAVNTVEPDPIPGLAANPGDVGATDGAAQPPPAVAELLARARQCRVHGDWAGAAAAYEQVISEHLGSSESTMCLVPLGQIQLERLGQPQQALESFREYANRAPAGPLLEEAEWGEAGALGALGRAGEERQTLQRFLEHHPGSLYVSQANERLGSGG